MSQSAQIYVSDLKKYLARYQMSPEEFAKNAQLSHMTIRRWLKKKNSESLPSKYVPTLGHFFGKAPAPELPKLSLARALNEQSMDSLMEGIEKKGALIKEIAPLEKALLHRLESRVSDRTVEHCCRELMNAVKSPKTPTRGKNLAKGALSYFSDPQGLPEETALIGYLGELAILSVALNMLHAF